MCLLRKINKLRLKIEITDWYSRLRFFLQCKLLLRHSIGGTVSVVTRYECAYRRQSSSFKKKGRETRNEVDKKTANRGNRYQG